VNIYVWLNRRVQLPPMSIIHTIHFTYTSVKVWVTPAVSSVPSNDCGAYHDLSHDRLKCKNSTYFCLVNAAQ